VRLHFEHKLVRMDIPANKAVFKGTQGELEVESELFLGCDGLHSATRRNVMRETRMDFSQTYISHNYKELTIPADDTGKFKMAADCLHIWPRHTFMMIALPNLNNTFTLTLFMPCKSFDEIKSEDDIKRFFETYFPDSIPLIGMERLLHDYRTNPTSPLAIIKCKPYHAGRTVFMGDAAHAMVPFYGQGMNAGFEDVNIFNRMLDENGADFDKLLAQYSASRNKDAEAICDLALYNYIEMRDLVTSRWFLFNKKIDSILHTLFPKTFIPLYSMVTFSEIPYAEVIERNRRQRKMVNTGLVVLGVAGVAGLVVAASEASLADHALSALSKVQEKVQGVQGVLQALA
jgi:kynurenine 3-monooxygenase